MMLLVVSKVKQVAKAGKLNCSMEFVEALSAEVGKIIIASAKACRESDMKTLKARHLTIPRVDELEAALEAATQESEEEDASPSD